MIIGLSIVIVASAALGLAASVVFSHASNRSPAWNLAFGAALVLIAALVLTAVVVFFSQPTTPTSSSAPSR